MAGSGLRMPTNAESTTSSKISSTGSFARHSGYRMLPGRFMVIQQAMGLPASRGPEAAGFLVRFVEDMKGSGQVAQALQRHHIQGASVAPLA